MNARPWVGVVVAAALLGGHVTAKAWGVVGHRIIGELAQSQLTPAARAKVADLLAGEPEPTLAGVAAWADTVRTGGTGPLHYINLPADTCIYAPARDCPDGRCLPAAMLQYVGVLANLDRPRGQRTQALKWVVHLVGDAHMPLHAGERIDRGGNTYQIQWEGRGTNLHALWDSGLLRTLGGDASAQARRLARHTSVATGGLTTWIEESCQITRQAGFYPGRKPGPEYLARWQPVLDGQLVKAGARLASVLNAALADP